MRKRTFFGIIMVLLMTMTGCTEQTELSCDALPTKVTVMGYVRYIAYDKNLSAEDPELVSPGHLVNIFYGIPNEKGNVEAYALKTVAVDNNAYFNVSLGCPIGKSLKVRVESSMYGESYAKNEKGKNVSCGAYFFSEQEATISCGSAHSFKIDMSPVANYGEDGLKQPQQ